MEAAAKQFEEEEIVISEFKRHFGKGDDMYQLFKMFPRAEENGYTPYCKIKLDFCEEYAEASQTQDPACISSPLSKSCKAVEDHRREVLNVSVSRVSSAGSIPCSLMDSNKNFSVAQYNVSKVKPTDSGDESDSEIFRVKRRSSKMHDFNLNDAPSQLFERQVNQHFKIENLHVA